MKNLRMKPVSRIALVIAGMALFVVLFVPLWRIDLVAPQYPEGLMLLIYPDRLAGNVDIINGLNHYIGMRTLHEDDFVEFKILPAIISCFAILFIGVGVIGRRKLLNILLIAFVAFGIIAMIDFWRWEYDYGHNLDPNAAIIVPGMAYQPPLIGFKQLLNFGAWSFPDIGGWIFVGAGLVLVFFVWYEARHAKRNRNRKVVAPMLVAITMGLGLSGCNPGPEPIRFGKDACHFCKMTISDNRYGAEIMTKKMKVYKFDDTHCLLAFMKEGTVPAEQVKGTFVTNFNEPHELLDVNNAFFLQSESLKSPMNGNVAAFAGEPELTVVKTQHEGKKMNWEELKP